MFFKQKKKFKNNYLFYILFLLLYFCSNNLIYADFDNTNKKQELIPMGQVLQLDTKLENLIVRNQVKGIPFSLGDEILKINGKDIKSYEDFSKTLDSNDEIFNVYLKRNSQYLNIKATKKDLEMLNLDDTLSGFATLTYIDPLNNHFGAVGHGISIGSCKVLPLKNGYIYSTKNLDIKKSTKGNVGSLGAKKDVSIGEFKDINKFGIKGISNINLDGFKRYEIASLDEIKTGKAKIILKNDFCDKDEFDIEILSIDNQDLPEPKTFKIKITDPELLKFTGGIVQGMSGTPIIQDNKIIGAISHAMENNPESGYGVFIKWMLNN